VLVYPAKKLAFCYIEKNACTQFNGLFNALNHKTGPGDVWWRSIMPNIGVDPATATREKGWKWAVFVRDPLVRYLSAWGSKCVQREDSGMNCLPEGLFSSGAVSDFEGHVVASHANPGPNFLNPHWAPQQDFCGGLHNASGYDFVGHLSGDVNSQVRDMLRMVDAPLDYVDNFFPRRHIEGHRSNLNPELFYRNATIRRYVHDMFKEDYFLPGLSKTVPSGD